MKNPLTQVPLLGEMFDDSQDQYMDMLGQNRDLYSNIKTPDLEDYNPDTYDYGGDYNPEMAQYQTVSDDPRIKSAQESVLNKMAGLADVGLSDVDQAAFEKARGVGNQVARAGNEAAIQNAQARGVSGSGLEYAMREMANQSGGARSQAAGLERAADAAKERALYNQAYGNMLGDVRGQDYRTNSGNADIINQFNQSNTNTQNQAALRNLNARQTVANANVDTRNQGQLQNNNIKNQRFQNETTRANGQAGVNNQMANAYAAQGAAEQAQRNNNVQMGMDAAMMAAGGSKGKKPQAGEQ